MIVFSKGFFQLVTLLLTDAEAPSAEGDSQEAVAERGRAVRMKLLKALKTDHRLTIDEFKPIFYDEIIGKNNEYWSRGGYAGLKSFVKDVADFTYGLIEKPVMAILIDPQTRLLKKQRGDLNTIASNTIAGIQLSDEMRATYETDHVLSQADFDLFKDKIIASEKTGGVLALAFMMGDMYRHSEWSLENSVRVYLAGRYTRAIDPAFFSAPEPELPVEPAPVSMPPTTPVTTPVQYQLNEAGLLERAAPRDGLTTTSFSSADKLALYFSKDDGLVAQPEGTWDAFRLSNEATSQPVLVAILSTGLVSPQVVSRFQSYFEGEFVQLMSQFESQWMPDLRRYSSEAQELMRWAREIPLRRAEIQVIDKLMGLSRYCKKSDTCLPTDMFQVPQESIAALTVWRQEAAERLIYTLSLFFKLLNHLDPTLESREEPILEAKGIFLNDDDADADRTIAAQLMKRIFLEEGWLVPGDAAFLDKVLPFADEAVTKREALAVIQTEFGITVEENEKSKFTLHQLRAIIDLLEETPLEHRSLIKKIARQDRVAFASNAGALSWTWSRQGEIAIFDAMFKKDSFNEQFPELKNRDEATRLQMGLAYAIGMLVVERRLLDRQEALKSELVAIQKTLSPEAPARINQALNQEQLLRWTAINEWGVTGFSKKDDAQLEQFNLLELLGKDFGKPLDQAIAMAFPVKSRAEYDKRMELQRERWERFIKSQFPYEIAEAKNIFANAKAAKIDLGPINSLAATYAEYLTNWEGFKRRDEKILKAQYQFMEKEFFPARR